MTNLLYVASSLRVTGPTKQLFLMISNLDRSKFKPYLLTLSLESLDSQMDDFKELDVTIITPNKSRIYSLFFGRKIVSKVIKENNITVVHTQGLRPDIITSKLDQSFKWIATLRNYPYEDYINKFGKLKGTISAYFHLLALKKCSFLAVPSNTTKKKISKHALNPNVIYNGVDFDKFSEGEKNRIPLDSSWETPVFVAVGNLNPTKNVIFLIKVFNEYFKQMPGTLLIVGDGVDYQMLKEAIQSDRIKLLGMRSDVALLLNEGDLFISASKSESMPNTVLEALASNTPCLLSDIPSHLELSEESGKMIETFELGNKQEFLIKLDQIVSEIADLDEAAYVDDIKSKFSAEAMIKSYESLYTGN